MATGRTKTQVVIVGAGLSGLSASKVLREHGVESIVLEAQDRVGGRTHTMKGPGFGYVDMGGAYIGPTQNHILKLVKELGIQTYKVSTEGTSAVWRKGEQFTMDSEYGVTNPVGMLDELHMYRTIDRMGAEIPVEAPWKAPHAEEWDRLTMKDVFDKLLWTKYVRRFADMFVHLNVTSEPHEVSALWFLWYIRQCGGVKRIFSVDNGGQERKLVGGTEQVSVRLAKLLGNRVMMNSPVSKVTQTETGVTIDTLSGDSYQAEYSIIAIPPPLQLRVSFSPSLPPVRNQMIQRMPMGSVIKIMTCYEKAYWTEKGMSGMAIIIEDDDCPVEFTMDDTKPDGSYPAIIGFVLADKARRYSDFSEEERRDLICQSYAKTFGLKELLHPTCYVEKNWMEEPYSGGCYGAALPPGVLTQFGRIVREPFGRVFFAGTETATHWSGYMEGAVQAGERAAREILHAMGKIDSDQVWQDAPQSEEVPAAPFVDSFVETYSPSISGLLSFIGLTAVVGLAVGASFIFYNQ